MDTSSLSMLNACSLSFIVCKQIVRYQAFKWKWLNKNNQISRQFEEANLPPTECALCSLMPLCPSWRPLEANIFSACIVLNLRLKKHDIFILGKQTSETVVDTLALVLDILIGHCRKNSLSHSFSIDLGIITSKPFPLHTQT